jgi:hypothetical protein
LDEITEAVELVCEQQKGQALEQMSVAFMTAFLAAKMRNAKTSIALYALSSDVEGAKIAVEMGVRANQAVVAMLMTAQEKLTADPQLVAAMLQSVMGGVSRRLLESAAPEQQFEVLQQEMIFLARAYLKACSTRV